MVGSGETGGSGETVRLEKTGPSNAAFAAAVRASSARLEGVAAALSSCRLDAAAVEHLLAEVRVLQRRTVGVLVALSKAALANEREGRGPVVEEVLGAGGTVGRSEARTEIERARLGERFPEVASGLTAGSVHTGNVDVLARMTAGMSDNDVAVLSGRDSDIADAASRLGEDSFRKRLQRMRDKVHQDNGATAAQQAIDDSFARVSLTRDRSTYRLSGQLDPLRGSAVQAALAREYRWLSSQPELVAGFNGDQTPRQTPDQTPDQTSDQRMAQAIHDLIMRGDSISRHTGSTRPNVSVVVLTDRQTMESGPHDRTVAETEDGTRLDPVTVGRLCCDAGLRRLDVLPDASVHVSHSGRTATPAQKAALRAMYEGCPISGAPWSQCEVHHVVFYRDSGRTTLSELVPISRRWHHLVHEGGWTLTMDADRTLILSRPDGTTHRRIAFAALNTSTATPRKEHALAA